MSMTYLEMDRMYNKELEASLRELTKRYEFKCYVQTDPNWCYGYIITPRDNVLCVQRDSYRYRGWTFSFMYRPSEKHGQGCQCFEDPVPCITKEIVLDAERDGLAFAFRLKANFFMNSAQWLKNYWNVDGLREITV